MTTSLIITTYNSKRTLFRVLDAYRHQVVMPDEIIIADDGSSDGTDLMIAQMQADFPCPLKHIWQPDEGFRAARIRNMAAKQAACDYLIFTDGDCIPHPMFVNDHHALAGPGLCVGGYRIRLSGWTTKWFAWHGIVTLLLIQPNLWRHLFRGIRLPTIYKDLPNGMFLAGCNMSMYRKDYFAVNGFNEDFYGWGSEDEEISIRLNRYGLSFVIADYHAIVFHLRHVRQSRNRMKANMEIRDTSINQVSYMCDHGVYSDEVELSNTK